MYCRPEKGSIETPSLALPSLPQGNNTQPTWSFPAPSRNCISEATDRTNVCRKMMPSSKLYNPSTVKFRVLCYGLNHGLFSPFSTFVGKVNSRLNWKFRIKTENVIVSKISGFHVQANLTETSLFCLPKWLCLKTSFKCLQCLGIYNFCHDHDASFIPFFYKGVLSGSLRLPKEIFIICNMVQVYPAQTWIVFWLRPRYGVKK